MNTNQSQHQFSPSQNTHHSQLIQPTPQLIQATLPSLKHQLPPELKPKRLKMERQLKPKTDLKHNLHCDLYPNLISIVTQTRSHRETQNTQTTTTNPNPATTETTHHFKPSNHQFQLVIMATLPWSLLFEDVECVILFSLCWGRNWVWCEKKECEKREKMKTRNERRDRIKKNILVYHLCPYRCKF